LDAKPPNIERPRTVDGLAPGYERIHREASARIRRLAPADLDRTLPFFGGPRTVRSLLWDGIVAHAPSPRPADAHVPIGWRLHPRTVRTQSRGDRSPSIGSSGILTREVVKTNGIDN
jgi:hypothetical protein